MILVKAILILLRYRLAPQYPYPAALDDCYTATRYLLENAAEYETDSTRIAVAGKIKIRLHFWQGKCFFQQHT